MLASMRTKEVSMPNQKSNSFLDGLPEPKDVQARLAELYQEAAMLRRLLRLADQKAKSDNLRRTWTKVPPPPAT